MIPYRLALIASGTLLMAALGGSVMAQGFFDTAPQPGYSSDQAARGKSVYTANCQSCHGAGLDDGQFGPPIKGASFKARWSSPDLLFAFIATKMPPTGPGALSTGNYADLVAWLMNANGVPAGGKDWAPPRVLPPVQVRETIWGPANHDAVYQRVTAQRTSQLAALTPVSDAMLRHPADSDWLIWRRTYQNLAFSPLAQIGKTNVQGLQVAWSLSLPVSPNEMTPLVHDGVLFVNSANLVQALDAASGDVLWQYVRPLPLAANGGRGAIAKNLAIFENRLYVPTADGHLIALDVKNGVLLWDHVVIGPDEEQHGVRMDGGPLVAKGKVLIGTTSCNAYAGGCFIVGLDARTGAEAWRFHTIARPRQPGGDSWNGAPVDQRFGGSVWTSGSYDPDLNLVFYGVGQTYDTATLLEPKPQKGQSNDALYTDSTVALDPDSGKLVWHYQHMNRDVWDLDWVFEQSLLTLPINGKPADLVVTGGKIALFDAMDRKTGKYQFSRDLGVQNLVSGVDPVTGHKNISAALTPAGNQTKLLCPHGGGARSWPTTAFDPQSHILYVPLVLSCAKFTYEPRPAAEVAQGGNDMHWILVPRPDSDGNMGRIAAIDLTTGKPAWTVRQRAPIASSMLATAGGLVFNGDRDRYFHAFDAATGKLLWQTRLNAVPSSSPITYGVNGTQYVAVVAGGGGAHEATWPPLTPEIANPAGGTTLWIFRLPRP